MWNPEKELKVSDVLQRKIVEFPAWNPVKELKEEFETVVYCEVAVAGGIR